MKIKKSELEAVLEFLKPFNDKKQTIELQIKDGILVFKAFDNENILILKNIKTDEKDTEKVTREKNWLERINRQNIKADEEIMIKINKKTLTSKVNDIVFRTAILENAKFEIKEEEIKETPISLTREMLDRIKQAEDFAQKTMTRPILNGINLKIEGGKLIITATDSYKAYTVSYDTEIKKEISITMPKKTSEILQALSKGARGVPVIITKNNIYINEKAVYYKSALFDGEYPSINKIIKSANEEETIQEITISEEDFKKLKSIKQKNGQLLNIRTEGKELVFKTGTNETTNELFVEYDLTNEFEVACNYENMILALELINSFQIKKNLFLFKTDYLTIMIMGVRIHE